MFSNGGQWSGDSCMVLGQYLKKKEINKGREGRKRIEKEGEGKGRKTERRERE